MGVFVKILTLSGIAGNNMETAPSLRIVTRPDPCQSLVYGPYADRVTAFHIPAVGPAAQVRCVGLEILEVIVVHGDNLLGR
jgi:hypothetical protein